MQFIHRNRLWTWLILLTGCFPFLVSAQQSGPERWEEVIRKFEAGDKASPVQPGVVLFVGSSSIALWKNLDESFPEYRVLNRGFGGSNFSDLIHYADRVIFPYKPSVVFIYEGDNDLAGGGEPADILRRAVELREMIRKELVDAKVVFISPKPSVARWNLKEKYEDLNGRLKEYASGEPSTEFADVWTPALGPDGKVLNHIFVKDNLHLNAEGYKIWQEVLSKYMPEK